MEFVLPFSCVKSTSNPDELCLDIRSLSNSVINGGRPKFGHINTPLWSMALPWRASLLKLPMAVGKKSAIAAMVPPFNDTSVTYTSLEFEQLLKVFIVFH